MFTWLLLKQINTDSREMKVLTDKQEKVLISYLPNSIRQRAKSLLEYL